LKKNPEVVERIEKAEGKEWLNVVVDFNGKPKVIVDPNENLEGSAYEDAVRSKEPNWQEYFFSRKNINTAGLPGLLEEDAEFSYYCNPVSVRVVLVGKSFGEKGIGMHITDGPNHTTDWLGVRECYRK
jgi:hypothetical protein